MIFLTELHNTIFNNLLIHCNNFDILGETGDNQLFLYPDNLGSDGIGKAVIEISFVPVDDSRSAFIQINTTLLNDVDMSKLSDILLLLNKFNTYCLIGHYGVSTDSAKLYHKQILITNNNGSDAVSDTLIAAIDLILDMLNKDYGNLIDDITAI